MGTRQQIVEAAGRVMRTKGLARSTTKEIAREAGYSEGTIYKHFESKEELFLSVLTEYLPSFVGIIEDLPQRAGKEPLGEVLEEVTSAALAFYGEAVPMAASIFAEPELLARHREEVLRKDAGPQKPNEALAAYLDAERNLGRVREDIDCEAASAMLLGGCFQRAFFGSFFGGREISVQGEGFVEDLVQTLLRSLVSNGE